MGCSAPTISVGGVDLSTNPFTNAQQLIQEIGSDQSDPTNDDYEGYTANGKNSGNTTGITVPAPVQTALPDPIAQPAKASDEIPPPSQNYPTSGCPIWDGINYDYPLSTNFTLRYLTVGGGTGAAPNAVRGCMFPHELTDIPGYSKQVRFCNLLNLAQNVLEPLWARFGQFRINSGIRNDNSVPAPGTSQHVTGQAVDIQFPGWTYDTYWQNAQWVKDNIAYDQFIFEHSSKSQTVWLHLSYKAGGGRAIGNRTKVMTMYRGQYDSGLKKYY